MNIFEKLQTARVRLQGKKLQKSGRNAFSKYSYFELGDFLPEVQKIFHEVGLCGVISFDAEYARLVIREYNGEGAIVFTSPMASADLKGCHPIQSLGAVQTYQRRYLWMTALEIVEHDALDSGEVTAEDKPAGQSVDDYENLLRSCTSIKELMAAWQTVPKAKHRSLAAVKDEMKTLLSRESA